MSKKALELTTEYFKYSILFPFLPKWNLKSLFVCAALHQGLLLSGNALMYPDVEEALLNKGIDPKVAKTIGDEKAWRFPRVLPTFQETSLKEKAYNIATSFSLIAKLLQLKLEFLNYQSGPVAMPNSVGCQIRMTDNMTEVIIGDLAKKLAVREDVLDTSLISDDAMYVFFLAHEQAHCVPDMAHLVLRKAGSTNRLEKESDMVALKTVQTLMDEPNISEFMKLLRAASPLFVFKGRGSDAHDISLYIDALIKKTPLPSYEDITASRAELAKLAEQERVQMGYFPKRSAAPPIFETQNEQKLRDKKRVKNEDQAVWRIKIITNVLQKYGDTMSPLAKIRAELFLEAYQTFAPSLIKAVQREMQFEQSGDNAFTGIEAGMR